MKEGDKVTWTHSYQNGRTINFSTRQGNLIRFIGSKADIKYRGEIYRISLDRLRPVGIKTELTEMVLEGLRK